MRSALALLAAALIATAFTAHAQEAATESPRAADAPAISVATIKLAEISDRVYASGIIQAVELVAVAPQIEGQQIEALLADVGDQVAAGQVLAQLSDDALILQRAQLDASVASATASIAQAEASLTDARASAAEAVRVRDRTQALSADGTVSNAAADTARAAAESALARVAASEQGLAAARAQQMLVTAQIADLDLKLERTQITAPVGGIITSRNAQIGAIASAAGPSMFVLIREGLLELQADVAEQDVLKLTQGQTVTIRPVGVATPLTGTVRLVEPTVDAVTRLGRVRIALDTPEAVRSGLFAEAEILVTRKTALTAPVTAVAMDATGAASVLRVDEAGKVALVPVKTGVRDSGLIEILTELQEGDLLVARAGAFVRPGDTINPVPVDAAAVSQ